MKIRNSELIKKAPFSTWTVLHHSSDFENFEKSMSEDETKKDDSYFEFRIFVEENLNNIE